LNLLLNFMPETIRSVQNPRVKNLVRLRNGGHRKRQQRFIVEGFREIQRALSCGWPVESLFFCEDLFKTEEAFDILHAAEEAGIEVVQMTIGPFQKAAYREGADGLLSVALTRELSIDDLKLADPCLLVVVEGIEKPGNLGAILRTANAAGADALVITDPVTDPFNPNTIRASQGAFFDLPFCLTDNATVIDFLERRDINPVLTSPSADKNIWEADLKRPSALVFGSEDRGLSNDWLQNFSSYKLPMQGVTDSLNVASSAAVVLFEAVRQRS
jgi:TrmH family RNA methyltransferase